MVNVAALWRGGILILLGCELLGGCASESARLSRLPHDAQGVPLLKDIYARDFLIGTALDFYGRRNVAPRDLELLLSQFDVITPENSMKPASLHPAEGRWNWAAADRLVQFCQAHHVQVIGHTLVWHAQTGEWFFQQEGGEPVSREQALARLKEHIETVVGHFKGSVRGWDVVNEAIDDAAEPGSENLRQSPWLRAIGPEYLTYAFRWAHEADPQAELYYNDYNIERGAKHESSLLLLKRLLREGAPITAVGIQGHWSIDYLPAKDLDRAISDYQALGLKVNITELDVGITGQGGGQLGPATMAAASGPATQAASAPASQAATAARIPEPTPQQLRAQAAAYGTLFRIFEKHRHVIDRVTFWGLNDARSWRAAESPLPFGRNDQPKPAVRSIALAKH